jgi:hypothetical protein
LRAASRPLHAELDQITTEVETRGASPVVLETEVAQEPGGVSVTFVSVGKMMQFRESELEPWPGISQVDRNDARDVRHEVLEMLDVATLPVATGGFFF